MKTPEEAARSRSAAIQTLEGLLNQHVEDAQKLLWEGLLARLKDLHADAALLPTLLAEYANTVLAPMAAFYGQSLLHLPGLQLDYFAALGLTDYQRLKAPLTGFLTARLGLDSSGNLLPGGYLSATMGAVKDGLTKQVLTFAYSAQASGVGLNGYRDGLNALILGSGPGSGNALGVVQELYRAAGEDFAQSDRMLHALSAKELGLHAYIYSGGLIDSSRPFCVARNGKVFLDWEIEAFGTKADKYPGYTNKAEGLFSGKSEPYSPMVNAGGWNCRHFFHAIPPNVATRMRADLEETPDGKLRIKPA